MALSCQLPGLYRYTRITEEASEAEGDKLSRSYDGMTNFSEKHKKMGAAVDHGGLAGARPSALLSEL